MFDLVSLGELLIDFTESGKSESGCALFQQNAGGATANVAVNLSSLGHNTAFIGKVGNDLCGKYLKNTLGSFGVDTGSLIVSNEAFTTLAFVALDENGERSFSFARNPGADTLLRYEEIDPETLSDLRILHVGSLSTTAEPSKTATFRAIETALENGAVISFDPNYRESLWSGPEEAACRMREIMKLSDMIKMTDQEALMITGIPDPEGALSYVFGQGVRLAAVTVGPGGAYVMAGGETAYVPTEKIDPVDTTGAGDAFWAGFVHAFLESGKDLDDVNIQDAVSFAACGNRIAAKCIMQKGAMIKKETLSQAQP